RHVINRSTLKKIDLLITTIFKFENSPGCQSENREGYNSYHKAPSLNGWGFLFKNWLITRTGNSKNIYDLE
ncbi:hypothetical protein VJ786_13340, partial [Sphingobacterium sp. PU5-4]